MGTVAAVVGGAALLAGAGYVVYKAYQAVTHAQAQEAVKEEGLHDAGVQDAGAPVQ